MNIFPQRLGLLFFFFLTLVDFTYFRFLGLFFPQDNGFRFAAFAILLMQHCHILLLKLCNIGTLGELCNIGTLGILIILENRFIKSCFSPQIT